MSQIDWTDVLDIGLPEIDGQHKHLIDLSNGLIQAMVSGMGLDVLDGLLKDLRDYTQTHFADEEAYMESINYPKLPEQKKMHAQLIREVEDFSERFHGNQAVSPNEVLDFMNGWIIKHIVEMDSQIGAFAKNQ